MANLRWSRRIQVSAAVLSFVAAACTDTPVVPESHDAVLPPPRGLTSTINGSSITIFEEGFGDAYTLNLETHEITRSSDGAILELDPEQTAAAATAFYGNTVADAILNDFGTVCSPEHPCADAMGTPVDGTEPGFILTKESESDRNHRGTFFGPSLVGTLPQKPFRSSRQSFDLMTGGICDDIVNAVFQNKLEYASNRTSFIRDGFVQGVLVGAGAVTRKALPPGTFAAARFMQQIAEAAERRVAISVLGWMWNSYYCSSQPVTAGPVIRSFGGGYTSDTGYLSCHSESWLISFDGGKTYSRINVEVCDYTME
jgi:hypothetical protein